MSKPKYIYVVEMLRWGNAEDHSYVIGVKDTFRDALIAGIKTHEYRGGMGKYQPRITQTLLNGDELNTIVHDIDQARALAEEMQIEELK